MIDLIEKDIDSGCNHAYSEDKSAINVDNNEEAIEDLLRHHTGESTDMAIKALGKDIPKAPKKGDIPRYGMGYEYHDWYCPTCNIFLAYECDEERQHIYRCERCGQRLDWTESEG